MIRLFVRHSVSDFSKWKIAYDNFDTERKGMGVKNAAVYQSTENPNEVTVCHDFESQETAKHFVESPRLREVMEAAGVAGEPTIWFSKKA